MLEVHVWLVVTANLADAFVKLECNLSVTAYVLLDFTYLSPCLAQGWKVSTQQVPAVCD